MRRLLPVADLRIGHFIPLVGLKIGRCTIAALLLTLLVLGSETALADTPLFLRGRVVDENGQPVADAQVKLEHVLGQVVSATSDSTGYFSLLNLASGEYTVHVEKQGFFVLANQKITLTPENNEFVFTLNHYEEVRAKVDVTVTQHSIEPAETQSTESVTETEIRDIPVASSHDLIQSLVTMPQIVRDNAYLLHIAGSRNTTAQYSIDGVEVNDPANNGLSSRMIVEAVRNAEIQTGRFGAEYAHPGAAVLNLVTREGDDRWRFNAVDFIPGINIQQGVQLGNYYPRAVISGPIKEGALWFSQSFDALHTLAVMKDVRKGQPNQVQQWGGDSWSRLLWKQSENNSLRASFLANVQEDSDLGLDALHLQSTTTDQSTRRLFGFVKQQSYWHETLFEFGAGVERTYLDSNPQGNAAYLLYVDSAAGNYFQKIRQDANRYQLFANGTRTSLHWHGMHTFLGGGNVSSVDLTQTAARGEIQTYLSDDTTLSRVTTFTGEPRFRVANTLVGGFVQDSWALGPHVLAQVGVRADWDRLFQAALVQPRAALNYMPFANDRAKFSVGWGMYDIPLNLSVIGQTFDQAQVDTLYFYGSQCEPPQTACTSGAAMSRFVLPAGGLASLKQPYFGIWSAGYQQRVGGNTLVSLELLARDEHHGLVFETISPQVPSPSFTGSDYVLRSSRRDKYRGATLAARHTFKNTAELFGSYTWSRSSTDQVLDPFLGSLYFTAQQAGPLFWDAPNRFLTWSSVPTGIWGILFSDLFEYRAGYTYSAINQQQFIVGVPNAYRFRSYASLTIGLEKKFTFRDRVFAARLSMVNLLDRQNPDVVVNNVDAPNFGTFLGGQGRAFSGRLRFVGRK